MESLFGGFLVFCFLIFTNENEDHRFATRSTYFSWQSLSVDANSFLDAAKRIENRKKRGFFIRDNCHYTPRVSYF